MQQCQAKHLKDYRSPDFTISHVVLEFDLNGVNTKVKATSQVKRLRADATQLALHGESLNLDSVLVDREKVNYQVEATQLVIEVDSDAFELVIETQIDPEANTSLEGLYMSDGAYCTQCEAEGFRKITYFLDRPDVLAKYDVRIEADQAAFPYILSNGNLVEKGELPNGRHFAVWEDPFPKPAYLFALVAGDFDLLEDSFITMNERKVLLQVFVDKGNLHKAHHAMASLKKSMAWDEQRFGLEYDLDIYMIVAVDFFNMGAMENKGLNVFNTKYVLADKESATDDDYHGIESVVGHEYFHNWTGNRVTCRDWFQLSLKEGLTVFRDQEFSSDLGSRAVNRISAIRVMKNQQFAEDSGPMAHPIRPESVIEMNNFYTVTVYNKGAEVIRMMHTLLGEDNFQAGMRLYFERHDGQAVTCDDFVNAMQDASDLDLTQFKLWYSQAGTPVVSIDDHFDPQKKQYTLTVSQTLPDTPGQTNKQAMHIPFDLELLGSDGQSLVNQVLDITQESQRFVFDGLTYKPTPSLFQNFSAPIRLQYEFSDEQLVNLMRFASSEVARWEASVQLISQAIWLNITRIQSGSAMVLAPQIVDGYRGVLLDPQLDSALVAEIFTLPSAASLIEQVDSIDLDALEIAREFVEEELAAQCEDELLVKYRQLHHIDSVGARALKSRCLMMLLKVSEQHDSIAKTQFEQADNMTDTLAVLSAVNNSGLVLRDELMAAFERKWIDTPLVMDKWLMLQGGQNREDIIDRLAALEEHAAFSFTNPNRVRSLVGGFVAQNLYRFHAKDGSGYRYLTDILKKLNGTNPQIASRLVTPLIQYQKFDDCRKQQIKKCLKELLTLPDLSKDLYEKVSKALL
ncbi:aminopeptidase N [Shewanella gelidii]|uniref:Aminopeptidase N n=1 Tax=Shewanella gelidii TaxID=1642821 RepID=A0A917JVW2_9GAMM|nr:aminopeptidase N [Shewanella gelidii]MCL1099035.1 aminopeptidase N [Shewanella gelidii]GGI88663.1 aminopeptidase N [Shewanella gelidii]